MEAKIVPCGLLKVNAVEMVKPLTLEEISTRYKVDSEGFMTLAMNALLVVEGESKVLIDPGTADFLPARLKQEYGFEMPVPLEELLLGMHVDPEEITDVIFTHLHFDHGSGAFKRVPGNIIKRFPHARYHVLKKHYQYALSPDRAEASSFTTILLKRLDQIHWLEDWDKDWISFEAFLGHTKGMVVPEIKSGEGSIYFMSDLLPMEIFLKPGTWCGYDLDPDLLLKEKQEFLQKLRPESRLIFFHDPLKESIIYE
jgi:glyoxylase-like metal-dependent hydrolase (beta-lactamase superfamily II)